MNPRAGSPVAALGAAPASISARHNEFFWWIQSTNAQTPPTGHQQRKRTQVLQGATQGQEKMVQWLDLTQTRRKGITLESTNRRNTEEQAAEILKDWAVFYRHPWAAHNTNFLSATRQSLGSLSVPPEYARNSFLSLCVLGSSSLFLWRSPVGQDKGMSLLFEPKIR
jgi:hypothetical protein